MEIIITMMCNGEISLIFYFRNVCVKIVEVYYFVKHIDGQTMGCVFFVELSKLYIGYYMVQVPWRYC